MERGSHTALGTVCLGKAAAGPAPAAHPGPVAEARPALAVAQLGGHRAEAAELPRSEPSAGGGWKRREEPLPLPADEAVPLLPPAAPTPPLMLIRLLIQPDAEPVRFTELAENKPRSE